MKKWVTVFMGVFLSGSLVFAAPKSAAELEKEKASRDPYANDFGPEKLEEGYLKGLPASHKEGYTLLLNKCAKCHSSSRPLNSQFVEPLGKNAAERKANLEKLKKETPDLFKDKNAWQIEANMWERYVKRMMAKPGCGISKTEGKKIWEFLVYDSNQRKVKDAARWKAHREKLLSDFKAKNPARYKELYGGGEGK